MTNKIEATTAEPMVNPNSETIKGLRELADFLEAHPGMPLMNYASVCKFCWSDLDTFKQAVENLGTFAKRYTDYEVTIERKFSGGVALCTTVSRAALGCKKIVKWDCPDESLMRQLGMLSEEA